MVWASSFFLLVAICISACAGGGNEALRSTVRVKDGQIIFALENSLGSPIKVSDFMFEEPVETGYWVFLYDPRTKKTLSPGNILVSVPPSDIESVINPKREGITILPGVSREWVLSVAELPYYFELDAGRCYYLTIKYDVGANVASERATSSNTSRPVEVCF